MSILSVDYVEADIVRLNLSFYAKVDADYLNPQNYSISGYVVSPITTISVTVQEVIPVNNFGTAYLNLPVEPALSTNVVYLRTTRHSIGGNYEVNYSTLHSTDGVEVPSSAAVPYQARITKVDSILKSLPPHFDRRPRGLARAVLAAIGLQDDKIGGSKKEEFPPAVVPLNNTIVSISGFSEAVPPEVPPKLYTTVLGEGPQGGDSFTFWFIGWDLRPTGTFQVPFSGMTGLAALQGWTFGIQGSGDLFFRVGPDGANPVVDTGYYTLNSSNENCLTVFHGVIDVPNISLSLYRNGNLESTVPLSGYAPTNSPIVVGGFATLAEYPLTQGGFCGGGAVDVALNAVQVAAHYAAMVAAGGSVVPVDILAGSWNYNTNDANAVWPSSGNYAHTMLRSGSLTYTDQPLTWAS